MELYQRFFFCPKCGGKLEYREQNERLRLTCYTCSYIFYENPVVGVAAIVMNEKKQILLGRRKSGRYKGLWCIPCGYLEYDEDIYDGIVREMKEETNIVIKPLQVFTVQSNFHEPECHSVGVWFLSEVVGGQFEAGDDLLELAFFGLDSYPEMAFPTDVTVIEMLAAR